MNILIKTISYILLGCSYCVLGGGGDDTSTSTSSKTDLGNGGLSTTLKLMTSNELGQIIDLALPSYLIYDRLINYLIYSPADAECMCDWYDDDLPGSISEWNDDYKYCKSDEFDNSVAPVDENLYWSLMNTFSPFTESSCDLSVLPDTTRELVKNSIATDEGFLARVQYHAYTEFEVKWNKEFLSYSLGVDSTPDLLALVRGSLNDEQVTLCGADNNGGRRRLKNKNKNKKSSTKKNKKNSKKNSSKAKSVGISGEDEEWPSMKPTSKPTMKTPKPTKSKTPATPKPTKAKTPATPKPSGNTYWPTRRPTGNPSSTPSGAPSSTPTTDPTQEPSGSPTEYPTGSPSGSPSASPSDSPTETPSASPTEAPSESPTAAPSDSPSDSPTGSPTPAPTLAPTEPPTPCPSAKTWHPTNAPTATPTDAPTEDPTNDPTTDPTQNPTAPSTDPTNDPTKDPTNDPTKDPTSDPTVDPTQDPTSDPTNDPTKDPTFDPTKDPTSDPTVDPTQNPTGTSSDPSNAPTTDPTNNPTPAPSASPTPSPTPSPSPAPSDHPSTSPTLFPSTSPSGSPSGSPSTSPTALTSSPSVPPTLFPSSGPSGSPTNGPTTDPSNQPSVSPSLAPTLVQGAPEPIETIFNGVLDIQQFGQAIADILDGTTALELLKADGAQSSGQLAKMKEIAVSVTWSVRTCAGTKSTTAACFTDGIGFAVEPFNLDEDASFTFQTSRLSISSKFPAVVGVQTDLLVDVAFWKSINSVSQLGNNQNGALVIEDVVGWAGKWGMDAQSISIATGAYDEVEADGETSTTSTTKLIGVMFTAEVDASECNVNALSWGESTCISSCVDSFLEFATIAKEIDTDLVLQQLFSSSGGDLLARMKDNYIMLLAAALVLVSGFVFAVCSLVGSKTTKKMTMVNQGLLSLAGLREAEGKPLLFGKPKKVRKHFADAADGSYDVLKDCEE